MIWLVLAVVGSLLAGACGGGSGGKAKTSTAATGGTSEVCTKDKEGGEITVFPRNTAPTLDPYDAQLGSIQTGYEGALLYSTLVRYDADKHQYVPVVAESLTPNADQSVWTLKLRQGVVFGNGDPLDADALIADLDRHLSPDSKSRLKATARLFIASYEKVDPLTVTFKLTAPYGQFPALLDYNLGMVQDVKVVNQMGQQAFSKSPIGAGVGPYEIEKWAPPESIVLRAKDNWWGGPVCIKKITISFVPSLPTAYDAFKRGEADLIYFNRDPVTLDQAKKENPGRFSDELFNSAFMVMPNAGVKGYTGPLTDVRVRQAMSYAIDADLINQRAWGGKGWVGKGIVNAASKSLKPTKGLPYDPNKAKKLLADYKAETGWDGSIKLIASAAPASQKEAALTVAALLTAVGFKVNADVERTGQSLITSVAVDKNFEVAAAWGIINNEANLYLGLRGWDSRNTSPQNGYSSPDYDAALVQMRDARTPEQYQASLDKLQEIVNRDVPFITYGADEGTTFFSQRMRGIIWDNGIEPILDKAFIAK